MQIFNGGLLGLLETAIKEGGQRKLQRQQEAGASALMGMLGEALYGKRRSGNVAPDTSPEVAPSGFMAKASAPVSGKWLNYANQGATRNQPLNDKLVSALGFLPEMGVTMKVFSGGQDATGKRRTGSHRHDHGNSADVFFYKDGRQLDWANPNDLPVFQEIVSRGRAAGVTGFGAGKGYMQPGSMHLGFGSPAVWGAGGKGGNAPGWLRSAFNSPSTDRLPMDGMFAVAGSPVIAPVNGVPEQPMSFGGRVFPDAMQPQGAMTMRAVSEAPPEQAAYQQTPLISAILAPRQAGPMNSAQLMQALKTWRAPTPNMQRLAQDYMTETGRNQMFRNQLMEAVGRQMPSQPQQGMGDTMQPPAILSGGMEAGGAADMPMSQKLYTAIADPRFKFLPENMQKFVMDEFDKARELENPGPGEPIKVGDTLLDPKTYKPLYTPPDKPVDPLEQRRKELENKKLEAEISASNSPDARKKLGLNPIYGKRGDNLVVMQPSETGGLVEAQLPEGVTLQPGMEKVDLGTAWGIMDRSGAITQVIPKDLAGEESAKAAGKAQGEAIGQAPAAKLTAEQTIAKIDELLADPGLGSITGYEAWLPEGAQALMTGGKASDIRRRVEQLRGSAFLEAYNGLKGGGQITEVEGRKAEDALARLDTVQTDEGYRQALMDFRDAVAVGYQKLAAKAGGKVEPLAVQPEQPKAASPTPKNIKPGDIIDGWRFKGGDPASMENWEMVE